MSENKYKIFRNFMANELGITRDDIKEWTMQAVTEAVERTLRGLDMETIVHNRAECLIGEAFKYYNGQKESIAEAIRKIASEQIEVSVRLKEKKNVPEKT